MPVELDDPLERLVEVLLLEREPGPMLHGLARTVGEALGADRVRIHRVSFATGEVVALSDWLDPRTSGGSQSRTLWPLEALCGAERVLDQRDRWLESHAEAPNPALEAEPSRVLHQELGVRSAAWFAFGHGPDGFLVLSLRQVTWDRPWSEADRRFVAQAARIVELALEHLDLRRRERAADQRYRALFDQSPSMFFVVDRSLRIVEVNPAAVEALGYAREELVGEELTRVFHPEDAPAVERHLNECLRALGEVRRWQGRKLRKDGRVLWIREAARALADPALTFVVCDDVTATREIELALASTQRSESLGLLAAGLAHDFGNVLTSVDALTELARTKLPPSSPAVADLEHVLLATDRASALVRQLMAYAGRASFSRQPVQLDRVVHGALDLVRGALGPRVLVKLELAPDLPSVDGDATQLEQVVVNLVLNACDALGEAGGTVTIRSAARGGAALLEVEDDGPGMDEATAARVFEPFFSTRGPGHGLGLAASAGLVKAHGGRIGVRTSPGRGATFTVELPPAAREGVVA